MNSQPGRRRRSRSAATADLHRRVSALIASGNGRIDAIERVAKATGRSRSSVSAAFYRVEKDRSTAAPVRPPAATGEPAASDAVIDALISNMAALAEVLRAQQAENAVLRARLEQARDVLLEPRAEGRPTA